VSIDLNERLQEYLKDARTLLDYGEQAQRHVRDGDLQGACNTISISAYKLSHLQTEWEGLLEEFERQGVTPGGK